ncbi:importin-4 isoform X2 [Rhineura floridana]|uniref:importin-4 isoform X2 n=1 Tax=Rhineura floridana TaxID=261503 RepID=UPI002AC81A34|nr:importin-4 isoform X2 [Rhineura floridana]
MCWEFFSQPILWLFLATPSPQEAVPSPHFSFWRVWLGYPAFYSSLVGVPLPSHLQQSRGLPIPLLVGFLPSFFSLVTFWFLFFFTQVYPLPLCAMATEALEKILSDLLQPDNAVIQQATAQLKETLKEPSALSQLCCVMSGSQNPQIRQFAAVLVRRRLTKHWRKISAPDQDMLKRLVLTTLQQETDHKVSLGLAQLAAVILKNEKLERWPQMLKLIQQGARSQDPSQCEVGLLLLHCALELDPEVFASHFKDLLRLFHQTLNNRGQPATLYYSLRSLTTMVPVLGSDEMSLMSSMVPKVIAAIRELISVNETHASEVMEVFDELTETEVSIIVQHLSAVVGFCLEVASNQALGDNLRVKALSCISFLIKLKGKAILKHKLLSPILNALFPIMSAEPPPGQMDAEDEQTEDDVEDRAEVQTPKHYAAQVIDMLALHLPPEKLFPQLTPLMEPALLSANPYHRKAGLMCLAVLAEGCGDHIRHKHLQPMLQVVCRALSDESQVVRNAALFALGQFSENLQPDIARYSDDIMPLLLRYLEGIQLAHTSHMAKAYYALENFVENLEGKISPYLPALMERMLCTLSSPGSPRTKELAVSAIGAIAQAAQGSLLPYFQAVMDHLTGYLLTTREDLRPAQIQSVETVAVLASVMDRDVFLPLADKCCQFGLELCNQVDDPDLRRCTYSLFGSLAAVLEDSIAPYLPRITTLMIYSLKSTEGIEEEEEAEVEGDESLTDEEEEDDDSEITGLNVGSAFMDEKEDACVALGEIATGACVAFLPFLETCFQEVFRLLEYPYINVRKSAFNTLGHFCISLHSVCERDPSEPHSAALQKLLSMVLPAYMKGIREDKERQVVMEILESLAKILKTCRQEALREPGQLAELCRVVREVLENKTACQDSNIDDDGDDDCDEVAEYDAMLIEYAGEVIPALAEAAGGEAFAPYFAGFLPLLINKMKPSCSATDKSFAVGTMAEAVQGLGHASSSFVPRMLPVLMGAARDPSKEVRSNAIFGLGVLAEHGGEAMYEHYPKLLGLLSSIISQERNNRVADNVCGAVARMVMANSGGVPIGQVFPVLLHALPLKEDLEEYKTVFRCISFIYEHDPQQVLQQMGEVVQTSSNVLGKEDVPSEGRNTLVTLLRDLSARCPSEFQMAVRLLPSEAGALVIAAVSST